MYYIDEKRRIPKLIKTVFFIAMGILVMILISRIPALIKLLGG